MARRPASKAREFDFDGFRRTMLDFLEGLRAGEGGVQFRYARSCTTPTLYASAYACMTYSLLGELGRMDVACRKDWVEYFDSFQNPDDGLFHDPAVANDIYHDVDWWGARHLALHLISAYTDLGARPAFPFRFLRRYCDSVQMHDWLNSYDWSSTAIGNGDLDNRIMNLGCLLQYQRDGWNDGAAAVALEQMKRFLLEKINPETGIWGGGDLREPSRRSRMVQFAYHLLPLFLYDGFHEFDHERIVALVLRTQNSFGGYGPMPNSSACEDIDSLDLLVRLAPYVSDELLRRVTESVERFVPWVMLNQVDDGGFVFRLNEPFVYGSPETASGANEGAMLPTWFRTLSLAYATNFLSVDNGFVLTSCPGYEFS